MDLKFEIGELLERTTNSFRVQLDELFAEQNKKIQDFKVSMRELSDEENTSDEFAVRMETLFDDYFGEEK